jgi:hypothetical protein
VELRRRPVSRLAFDGALARRAFVEAIVDTVLVEPGHMPLDEAPKMIFNRDHEGEHLPETPVCPSLEVSTVGRAAMKTA